MANRVTQILAKPIQLADQVIKAADEAASFRQECADLKSKAAKLADLLRQAARSSSDLYERPTARIIEETNQTLSKALSLSLKCRSANGIIKRAFTLIPAAAAFRKLLSQLENSIGDVSWLLRVSSNPASYDADDYLGLPPIAANEPILCLIWEQIAILHTGSQDDRADAAGSLVSLARDNDRYGKLIIEEGGVGPLLKLVKEGRVEGQESAARAIGLLGRDEESVEYMVNAGVCQVFVKVLKEGPMKVQAVVAWAISELAAHYPKCQDLFAEHNVVRLLVSHLAFETIEDHSKYTVVGKAGTNSIHNAVVAIAKTNNETKNGGAGFDEDDYQLNQIRRPNEPRSSQSGQNQLHSVVTSTIAMTKQATSGRPTTTGSGSGCVTQANGTAANLAVAAGSIQGSGGGGGGNKPTNKGNHRHSHSQQSIITGSRARELEDPATKANMKAMAARALGYLAKDNSTICRRITESRALLCLAVLLEKGTDEIPFNSAITLMEITSVAEKDAELRRSAFRPNSPACKAVIDQLLRVIENPDLDLLLPCVRTIGNLARTFRATETRMIRPLVVLLDENEPAVSREAAIALTKFAETDNYLHLNHCKEIIEAGGIKHLVQLVYFEQTVQVRALVLLAYIAKHVPESQELAENGVLNVLDWALKQGQFVQDEWLERLLFEAKSRVELYQSRGSR